MIKIFQLVFNLIGAKIGNMKKIKIAQIGIGHDHAGVIFNALNKLTDIFEVVGYAEVPEDDLPFDSVKSHKINTAKYYENSKKYTVEELFSMPLDAVVIETYDLNIVKYAKMAVEKGLHIHIDKAPGENYQDFEELLSLIKQKNLAFSIGYMYRFNPLIKEVFSRVKDGDFGEIHTIDAEMSCYHNKQKREWLSNFKGGMMQFLGCHLIDLVVRLKGVPNEIISCNYSTGCDGVISKDGGLAVFKYDNCTATIKSNMADHGGFLRRHFIVNGKDATMEIRPLEKSGATNSEMSSSMTEYRLEDGWSGAGKTTKSQNFDRYDDMLIEFSKIVRGEHGYLVDLEMEARVQRCLVKANGLESDFKGEINL